MQEFIGSNNNPNGLLAGPGISKPWLRQWEDEVRGIDDALFERLQTEVRTITGVGVKKPPSGVSVQSTPSSTVTQQQLDDALKNLSGQN